MRPIFSVVYKGPLRHPDHNRGPPRCGNPPVFQLLHRPQKRNHGADARRLKVAIAPGKLGHGVLYARVFLSEQVDARHEACAI